MHAIYASSKSYSIYARNVFTVNLACIYGVRFRGHTIKHAYMHATHAPDAHKTHTHTHTHTHAHTHTHTHAHTGESFLGKTLDKSQQCSDWDRRPLSLEQVRREREHARARGESESENESE